MRRILTIALSVLCAVLLARPALACAFTFDDPMSGLYGFTMDIPDVPLVELSNALVVENTVSEPVVDYAPVMKPPVEVTPTTPAPVEMTSSVVETPSVPETPATPTPTSVPEPSSMSLLITAGIGAVIARGRRTLR